MPSFAMQVKNELARCPLRKHCCACAELGSFLQMNGNLVIGSNQTKISLQTGDASIARKLFSLFKYCFMLTPEVSFYRQNRFQKKNAFRLQILGKKEVLKILQGLELITCKDGSPLFSIDPLLQRAETYDLKKQCCRRAYLRGAFLASGSLINPDKDYHLEIVAPYETYAVKIQNVMASFQLEARYYEKKEKYRVYLKGAEKIGELLRVMEAANALLEFENIRVVKSVRNQINRLVNCETANLTRTVFASQEQISNIRLIEKTLGLDSLPPSLREVARLRLRYPEATLKELGEEAAPPLSKSSVNHRLRRLNALARGIGK
jgi:DNA-binding protein WhiA